MQIKDKPQDRSGRPSFRLGIDVGGTNTDAALMLGSEVVATNKSSTTENIGDGVVESVTDIMAKAGIEADQISHLMIGTTQFINAFLQRRKLAEVAIVRVGLPKGDGVPPMVCWPSDVLNTIGHHSYMITGGAFYTGVEYAPLDEDALEKAARDIVSKKITSVAVSSVFAPIRSDIEQRAADIIAKFAPGVHITKSSDVGGVGLVDRENATIVNACLVPFAQQVVQSLKAAFASVGVHVKPLFSQNDGTLISDEMVRTFPIFTCSAGPTNSIRGAGFLTRLQDAIVVDIGGTTTDIGFLKNGFPRETSTANFIGGVRTNFRMPDVLSIALGGGTMITPAESGLKIGPESVGYQLKSKGLIFGGDTLTATDIAVAAGNINLGDPSRVAGLDKAMATAASHQMHTMIEEAIDQMRSSAKPVDVILVGGGNILVNRNIEGAARVLRPEHAGVANAVGAAIAQVGGRIDSLYDYADGGRDIVLKRAKDDAVEKAVQAGAERNTIEIIDIEELPMTHMQSTSVRVRVNAVGELA